MSMITYDFLSGAAGAFGMSAEQRIAQQGPMAFRRMDLATGFPFPLLDAIRSQQSAVRTGTAAVEAELRRKSKEKPHVHLRDRKAPAWPTNLNVRWWE